MLREARASMDSTALLAEDSAVSVQMESLPSAEKQVGVGNRKEVSNRAVSTH